MLFNVVFGLRQFIVSLITALAVAFAIMLCSIRYVSVKPVPSTVLHFDRYGLQH